MAGDWIKMRVDLSDDPAVVSIAAQCGIDEDTVVGKLHRIWSWADRHTTDGKTNGVTAAWVDRYVACVGFADALVRVSWLAVLDGSIVFPGFEKHNGTSAKRRADGQMRQRTFRENRNANVTQRSRENIPRPLARYVYQRDNFTCVYCGVKSDYESESHKRTAILSIDHIRPVSQGGVTVAENLATCCRACNNEKNNRTPEEWGFAVCHTSEGVSYENGNIFVTKDCDEMRTREEKRREEKREDKEILRAKFVIPAVDDVRTYCTERGNAVDPQAFVDFYSSKGWMIGKNRMKDWKAAVRTWEKSDGREGSGNAGGIVRQAGNATAVSSAAAREAEQLNTIANWAARKAEAEQVRRDQLRQVDGTPLCHEADGPTNGFTD